MRPWQTARAWAAVHSTRPALFIMAVVASASMFFAQTTVAEFGFVHLMTPISVLLLLPAIAGVGTAIACDNTARLPLPYPARAVVSRAGWALSWTILAIVSANVGQVGGADANWMAVTRNVVVHAGLALLTVSLGFPHLGWLPPIAYTTVCMLFGQARGPNYYWWAAIMAEGVTVRHAVVTGCLFLGVLLVYLLQPTSSGLLRAVSQRATSTKPTGDGDAAARTSPPPHRR